MRVAVVGAGVMGAAIAGHFANVGIPTDLLDLAADVNADQDRNQLAQAGKKRLLQEKPSPLYHEQVIDLIQVGNLEDDLKRLSQADWIIEAVVENLDVKREILQKIESVWKTGTIVSSNTSGLSIEEMVSERSIEFRQHFLGTHFFNPPRYMRLLELIPTSETDPQIIERVKTWAEQRLGKGIVICKDTPNFIANRIGAYGMQVTFEAMEQLGLAPDEVDTVTGKALGRPKSATFRTLDLIGLDTFHHVIQNMHQQLSDPKEKQIFSTPPWMKQMIHRGWLGQKAGQGFYQKRGKQIFTLDLAKMEYRPYHSLKAPSLREAKNKQPLSERLQTLIYARDVAGRLAWQVTKKILLYAATHVEEIANDLRQIDQAMKWGFHWELGPFELWDAIGVEFSVNQMRKEGEVIPEWIEIMLAKGHSSFYQEKQNEKQVYTLGKGYQKIAQHPREISLEQYKAAGKKLIGNAGASLIDLGDGIACLEFHSPKGAIGPDVIQMIQRSIEEVDRKNYQGLVIANQNPHFCVGANLMLMLMEAQGGNWTEIDLFIRQFQQAVSGLKTLSCPVVAAPFGRTLGGGVEVCLPADRIQASAECYMGLVEVGVGLIPAGGGTKEMLSRYTAEIDPQDRLSLQSITNRLFEIIGQAKVSTSAEEARSMKFLREGDQITIHPDFLIYDAKQVALHLVHTGYHPPLPRKIPVVGETGYQVLKLGAYQMLSSGLISKYDYHIAKKLAYVLSGGRVPEGSLMTEQELLDLEREAFLSLIGEPKTQARMQYMLQNGKPLRN